MEYIRKNRFLLFLVLLFLGIGYPMLSKDPRMEQLYSTIGYTLILLSGLYAFSEHIKFIRSAIAIFIISIIIEWLQFFWGGKILDSLNPLMTSLVLILLLVMTLRSIAQAKEVNENVIFGVVSGYVLIGFIGGLLAMALARIYDGAFNVENIISNHEAIYFSFITMTTLGYGDITPQIEETQALSIFLSIVGPMYVAVIVALMVGKFASRKD